MDIQDGSPIITATQPHIIETSTHADHRGSHIKFFGSSPEKISAPGFDVREVFMTVNHKGTLRGLYGQNPPMGKLLQCLMGGARVNTLCGDPSHQMFGSTFSYVLHPNSGKLHIPRGWLSGYLSLIEGTQMLYLADEHYNPEGNIGVNPFDPELNLYWGENVDPDTVIVRDSDLSLPSFSEFTRGL